MVEQVKENPFRTQHSLIEGVRVNFGRRDEAGNLCSREIRSWGAVGYGAGIWVGREETVQFVDGDSLSGIDAASKIFEALEKDLEPFVAEDGKIGFKNPGTPQTNRYRLH